MSWWRYFLSCCLIIFLVSCGSSKRSLDRSGSDRDSKGKENTISEIIVEHALDFLGTKYRYGGTSSSGMDCSGLIYTSFLKANIPLPRTSRDLAKMGYKLSVSQVNTGDLLFFETDKNRSVINHVGLVVGLEGENILFIHSSTSKGVIISALEESYWKQHFVMARRIL